MSPAKAATRRARVIALAAEGLSPHFIAERLSMSRQVVGFILRENRKAQAVAQ